MRTLLAVVLWATWANAADPEPPDLIDKARQVALSYTDSLPDFICTQVVTRWEDPAGNNRWQRHDILTVKLSYYNHHEEYKLTHIDGKETTVDFMDVGGPTTKGEFGTLLYFLFHPQMKAEFHWKGWATVRKHRAAVYTYRVDQEHTQYHVAYGKMGGPDMIRAPYHGEVFIEPESAAVLRAVQDGDLPKHYPIQQSDTIVDYDYAEVGGRRYLLPLRAEIRLGTESTRPGVGGRANAVRYRARNEVVFKDYRKFQTETTITFEPKDK